MLTPGAIMFADIMPSVVMPSVVIPNVVAPLSRVDQNHLQDKRFVKIVYFICYRYYFH
jgi:hypothetical protein